MYKYVQYYLYVRSLTTTLQSCLRSTDRIVADFISTGLTFTYELQYLYNRVEVYCTLHRSHGDANADLFILTYSTPFLKPR
jgi:hypothetical protein